MVTRAIAEKLCRILDTRNPFELAASLGIVVLYEPLGSIQGYYNKCYRQKFIHINEELDGYEATFACAHELGHAILHSDVNTPFLRKNTMFSVGRIETEANRFALDLLFEDEELQPFLERSITDAAAYMGVDVPLAKYRMEGVVPTIWGMCE